MNNQTKTSHPKHGVQQQHNTAHTRAIIASPCEPMKVSRSSMTDSRWLAPGPVLWTILNFAVDSDSLANLRLVCQDFETSIRTRKEACVSIRGRRRDLLKALQHNLFGAPPFELFRFNRTNVSLTELAEWTLCQPNFHVLSLRGFEVVHGGSLPELLLNPCVTSKRVVAYLDDDKSNEGVELAQEAPQAGAASSHDETKSVEYKLYPLSHRLFSPSKLVTLTLTDTCVNLEAFVSAKSTWAKFDTLHTLVLSNSNITAASVDTLCTFFDIDRLPNLRRLFLGGSRICLATWPLDEDVNQALQCTQRAATITNVPKVALECTFLNAKTIAVLRYALGTRRSSQSGSFMNRTMAWEFTRVRHVHCLSYVGLQHSFGDVAVVNRYPVSSGTKVSTTSNISDVDGEPNVSPFITEPDTDSPLHWAAVSCRAEQGCATPLHYFAVAGHAEMVQWFVGEGARVEAKNWVGTTPLHSAVFHGATDTVRVFLDMCSPETLRKLLVTRNHRNEPVLYTAALRGHLQVLKILLAKLIELFGVHLIPADAVTHVGPSKFVGWQDSESWTPVHAATIGGHASIIEYLVVEGGYPPDCVNKYHQTPLHIAARTRQETALYALLKLGASPTLFDGQGFTPLDILRQQSIQSSKLEMVTSRMSQLLIQHGGNMVCNASSGRARQGGKRHRRTSRRSATVENTAEASKGSRKNTAEASKGSRKNTAEASKGTRKNTAEASKGTRKNTAEASKGTRKNTAEASKGTRKNTAEASKGTRKNTAEAGKGTRMNTAEASKGTRKKEYYQQKSRWRKGRRIEQTKQTNSSEHTTNNQSELVQPKSALEPVGTETKSTQPRRKRYPNKSKQTNK